MYHPTLDEVKRLAGQGNIVPIYREIMADLETPVSAYLKIARDPYSFLLESVEGGEHLARYSFIGTEPYMVLMLDKGVAYARQNGYKQTARFTNPLDVIASYLNSYRLVELPDLPRFAGGAVGFLGYPVVRYFEELPAPEVDRHGLPEAVFMYVDTLLVFDHLKRKIKVVSHVHLDGDIDEAYHEATQRIERLVSRLRSRSVTTVPGQTAASIVPEVTSNLTQEQYEQMVEKGKEYIRAGDVIQVVLSQRLSRPTTASPVNIYRTLRTVNPSPYMYYLHLNDFDIVGASPELLVQVEDGVVATHPIAGTRPRGRDAAEDALLENELKEDAKERAEHIMLVDLGRNDVGRVSEAGQVQVTQLMDVERYSHVIHLVSHVTGKLSKGLTAFDALQACFPAGTVSGAPKIRAMEIIAELEPDDRGPYAGAVGYFSYSGNLDTAITIRTIVIKDGTAHVQAGAGIVADSVPEREYQETLTKARGMLRAIEEAETLERLAVGSEEDSHASVTR